MKKINNPTKEDKIVVLKAAEEEEEKDEMAEIMKNENITRNPTLSLNTKIKKMKKWEQLPLQALLALVASQKQESLRDKKFENLLRMDS